MKSTQKRGKGERSNSGLLTDRGWDKTRGRVGGEKGDLLESQQN